MGRWLVGSQWVESRDDGDADRVAGRDVGTVEASVTHAAPEEDVDAAEPVEVQRRTRSPLFTSLLTLSAVDFGRLDEEIRKRLFP